jgi:hypothetical protein
MTEQQKARYFEPEWIDKSLAIKNLDDHTCQHCGVTHKQVNKLTAHHLFYIDNEGPAATPTYGLVTVCEPCHKQEQKLFYMKGDQKKEAAWLKTLTTMMLQIFGQWMQDSLTKILQKRIFYALQFTLDKNKKLGTRMTKIVNEKILKALVPPDQWVEFEAYCRQREGGTNFILDFNENGKENHT